ncbi:ADAMTS-like protein 5 isoform X3 [Dendropsophus ebraccatus]|uniref:ADAMTS-like protein 5 isoform X3 n=1 Tax=Dendropsophus ebraccatus TaxID=150705 RepID=UPI003831C88B
MGSEGRLREAERKGRHHQRRIPPTSRNTGQLLRWQLQHVQGMKKVAANRILHSTSGVWTVWGPWTGCSSSCGEGVTLRTRKCQKDNIASACAGEQWQYKSCQSMLCPADSVPFRNIQCTLYNNKPIPGSSDQTYHWVPFYGAPISCNLNCLAVGHNFYYSFGRVLDGTSCGPDSDGTCINGQCLTAGCDGILGSGVKNDSCGNCVGQNDSCIHIKDVYRLAYPSTGIFGYKNVTRIPTGAMHIKVLFQEQNPGIEYEYWLPKDSYENIQRDSQAPQQPVDFALEAWVHTPTSTGEGDMAKKKKDHSEDKTDCQKCMQFKGRSQRKKHYCQSDFVIRGKILGRKTIGRETRYDIHIKHVYKNKFPLVHREYIWVSNKCDCPKLQDRTEYIMMPSKHVNYERTLNRILLTINSYVRPWSQHEDYQMQRLNRMCKTSS